MSCLQVLLAFIFPPLAVIIIPSSAEAASPVPSGERSGVPGVIGALIILNKNENH